MEGNLDYLKKKIETEERIAELYGKLGDKAFSKKEQSHKKKSAQQTQTRKTDTNSTQKAQKNSINLPPKGEEALYKEFDETYITLKKELKEKDPNKYRELFGDDE